MRQFFVFLFTGTSVAILDLIDSAFGNHISLDSICVMSAFTVIIDYGVAILMVLPMKGVVDFKSALIITLLYIVTVI